MQLADRIEARRFVGREFLLWLWVESELFDATLSTTTHGSFGLWIERRIVLSSGKESTRITAQSPANTRDAKEALLRGQLPESAGIRITLGDQDTAFVLKADQLSVSGLKLATVLDEDDAPNPILEDMAPKRSAKKRKSEEDAEHESHEKFYERMRLAQEFEALIEALYQDFISLRLSPAWQKVFVPMAHHWANGQGADTDSYVRAKKRLASKKG